jgi:hypothetical protein
LRLHEPHPETEAECEERRHRAPLEQMSPARFARHRRAPWCFRSAASRRPGAQTHRSPDLRHHSVVGTHDWAPAPTDGQSKGNCPT